jgi:hypothetical protein
VANAFDQFDSGGNPFDKFDSPKTAHVPVKATDGMSTWDKFWAGAGKSVVDVGRGVGQLVGAVSAEDVAEANRLDADLMDTTAGKVGNVAGEVAMLAGPLGAVGTSVKGAAAVGAVSGALRPTESTGWEAFGDRLKGAAIDSAMTAGGQAVANAGARWMAGKAAGLDRARIKNVERDKTLLDGHEAGFVAPPSTVNPTAWNTFRESFAGKAATGQGMSTKNTEAFERAARTDLHIPDDVPLNAETMNAVRDRAYQIGYKPVANLPEVRWTPEFDNSIKALSPRGQGGAVASPAQAEIEGLQTALLNRAQWTGPQLVHDIRLLREQARANFGAAARLGGDTAKTDLARAQKGAAQALEDLASQNLGDATLVTNLRAARTQIAKAHDVEDAIIEGAGQINPAKWAQRVQAGKEMSGQMGKAGRFANTFPKAAQKPTQASGAGVSALNPALGAFLGGSTFAGGGDPGTAVALAAAPFAARSAVRSYLMSGRSQKNVLRDMYRLSPVTRGGVNALRMLPYSPALLTEP